MPDDDFQARYHRALNELGATLLDLDEEGIKDPEIVAALCGILTGILYATGADPVAWFSRFVETTRNQDPLN